ncbi:SOS response-associated peptidase family protein [Novosphingobium soli]|uniref:SOS response-associated peptidase n=1 Tax=Novosphingobium soli TaxID=574956 RepID=A0ABV6CVJ7_9SPHN
MCNLYLLRTKDAEIAQFFGAAHMPGANYAEEVYPGYPGLVVADGTIRPMTWGFPLVLKSKKTGQPLKPKPAA